MSPKVLLSGGLLFWFHSQDALVEGRARVHVGKGSQDDHNDAKIWLEPEIELARAGRSLKAHELSRAMKIIAKRADYLRGRWHGHAD